MGTDGTESHLDWFLTSQARDTPLLRLFCFPHAGGGSHAYVSWPDALPASIEVVAISPPGRGSRIKEPPAQSLDAMAAAICGGLLQLQSESPAPFAFFGHSLGSVVAYEVARRLAKAPGQPSPVLVLASAHQPPAQCRVDPTTWVHQLDDRDFLAQCRARGFIEDGPSGALDSDVMEVLLPALRADLGIHERLAFDEDVGPLLPCPVVAMGGADDDFVSSKSLAGWSAVSACYDGDGEAPTPALFEGGHFYLQTDATFLPYIEAQLLGVIQTLPRSVLVGPMDPRFVQGRCVHELFDEQAERTPDVLAIVDQHVSLTFRELRHQSDLLAAKLQQLGVVRGSIVGSYLPHSVEYIIGNLAIFKAGAAIFPLETNYPADLIEELVSMAGIVAVLTNSAMRANLPEGFRSDGGQSLCLEGDWVAELERQEPPLLLQAPRVELDDVAYVTMTSGSTGKPKGVVNTHIGAVCNFLPRFEILPYEEGEVEALNVFFVWECLRPILSGVTACIIPDELIFDPKKLVNFVEAQGVTRLMTTTQLVEAILEHPGLDVATKLKRIKYWLLEGEPVPARVVQKWLTMSRGGGTLVNVYSTWESLDISYAHLDQPITTSTFAPVGQVIPNVSVYLLDDKLQVVPRGSIGEIFMASPGLAIEYLGDPVKTADKFMELELPVSDDAKSETARVRVYRSGDRGRILPSGDLECLGRIDSTVKIRGFKVAIPLVEATVKDCELVRTAAIMPVMDERTNIAESLIAYIVGHEGQMSDDELMQLKDELKLKLPPFAYPTHWMILESLPTKSGESRKLDRQALPKLNLEVQKTNSRPAGRSAASRLEEVILSSWAEIFGTEDIAVSDNFFEIGGHSLLAAKLVGVLTSKYGLNVAVLDLYEHPTIESLAKSLDKVPAAVGPIPATPRTPRRGKAKSGPREIAVVGMAGRFPSCPDIGAFWEVLQKGTDTLRRFSKEELIAKNVPAEVYDNPDYVPAGQVCDDVDKFDAAFFGIGKLEAEIMDPQHRVFMEVAWEAVENAGYGPRTTLNRNTGVFAASGIDGYLVHHLEGGALKTPLDPGALFMTEVGSEKDYIATRVSYTMDLHGPSINVQSACSSGLVAVAQAAQAMLAEACDCAIAGAASLTFPNTGYLFEDSLVYSVDGHVRPFDKRAGGTTFGDSVGAVVLKLLEDAAEDGDTVLAVLSGSAVTNDGGVKAGYTAPAVAGQSAAIVGAHHAAQISARDISYVECHATATNIGDAIEIRGLNDAFARSTDAKGFCALGSVKGNIGHANCAAGLTGFIKTVLCLHQRQKVPTAHYQALNPKIPLRNSPFYVHEGLSDWVADGDKIRSPLRAGVSSFGIGGTNAHAVLREWTSVERETQLDYGSEGRPRHLLTFSAKSEQSLKNVLERFASLWEASPVNDLTDAAYTLHIGRDQWSYRAAAAVEDSRAAVPVLRQLTIGKVQPNASVVMCFPGQGSQYIGMGQGLYFTEPVYRAAFDECCDILLPIIGFNLKQKLFVPSGATPEQTEVLSKAFNADAVVVQTSMFAVEYAMARLLIDCVGLTPIALVGHSIGEYAAAAVSGILTLADALGIVVTRATAMRDLCGEAGASGMLSARMTVADARNFAANRSDVWIACENTPTNVVFSGSTEALQRVATELQQRDIRATALRVSHGFHSPLVQPSADAVLEYAQGLTMSQPTIPMTSNVAGGWLDPDTMSAEYWKQQIVGSVRFSENIKAVSMWKPTVFLEVGPGSTLCSLVRKCCQELPDPPLCLQSMRHPRVADVHDQTVFLDSVGKLWGAGVDIKWSTFHEGERALRTPLPGYAFDKTSSFWLNPSASIYSDTDSSGKKHKASSRGKKAKPTPTGPSSPSLVYYAARKPDVILKVYCFPYAGASSQVFAAWARDSAPWLDVVAYEPPGRGGRASEPHPCSDEEDLQLVKNLAHGIRKDFAASQASHVALLGFSMGCLVGVEVAQLLQDLPIVHAFFAGRAPPFMAQEAASVAEAVADRSSLNLAPKEVVESEEWTSYFLPMLDADLDADARAEARIRLQQPRLRCAVDLFCGLSDTSFPWEDATKWQAVVNEDVPITVDAHYFPGGHDFLKNSSAQIFQRVENSLASARLLLAPVATEAESAISSAIPGGVLHAVTWERLDIVESDAHGHTTNEPVVLSVSTDAVQITDTHVAAVGSPTGLVLSLEQKDDASSVDLEHDIDQCAALVEVFQALLVRGVSGKLVVVSPASARGAMAAGLTKVVPLEWPELTVQRVFLRNDSTLSLADLLPRALDCVRAHDMETDVLVHFKRRRPQPVLLAPRLGVLPVDHASASSLQLGLTGPYIVSGGMGGVGSALVNWLIDAQAVTPSQIVILTRRSLDTPHQRGATVVTVDVSNQEALLNCSALREMADVAGIFHLAGLLDDGMLTDMNRERVAKTVAPKATGALNLQALVRTCGWAPDWLLCFSSTSSLGGYAGQANYCAANAVLDQLAQWGSGSFNDGCASMPVVAVGTKAHQLSLENGEIPLTNAQGLGCLATVLAMLDQSSCPAQFAACSCDWPKTPWQGMPLLQHVSSPDADGVNADDVAIDGADGGGDEEGGEDSAVVVFLKQRVPRWDMSAPLSEAGLDSLDVVSARNKFNKQFKGQLKDSKPVQLEVFSAPNTTLAALISALEAYLV